MCRVRLWDQEYYGCTAEAKFWLLLAFVRVRILLVSSTSQALLELELANNTTSMINMPCDAMQGRNHP